MKTKILDWFETNCKELQLKMQSCKHYHSNGTPNPFHMENDVWSHTLMVLDKVPNDIELILAALLHDIGKVETRIEKQSGRVSFRLHENVSTYKSIDILKNAQKSFDFDIVRVLQLIAWHGKLWNHKEVNNVDNRLVDLQFGFSNQFYQQLVQFTKADAFGRVFSEDVIEEEIKVIDLFEYFENYIPYNTMIHYERNNKKEVVCMIGISGSGKSTWISQNTPNYKVVGVDKFFDKMKSNYDHIMYEKVVEKFHIQSLAEMKEYINNNENVVIDMTNVSKEMRRKKLSQFPITKYHKKAVVFLTGETKLKIQLSKRESKTIPYEVIQNQILNFELPSYDEFDEIIYIL